MKCTSTRFFFLFLSLYTSSAQSQSAGDYRSNVAATGHWSEAANWQRFDGTNWQAATAAPTASDGIITIQEGDSIRLTTAATIDQVHIQSGGILAIFDLANPTPKIDFIVPDASGEADIQVAGKLYLSVGARLTGSGTINIEAGGLFFLRRQSVLAVATLVQPGANMYIDEDPTLQNTLTNNGTITWFRNNLRLVNGTIINNATLNLLTTGNAVVTNDAGLNSIHNTATGIILRANSGGTLYLNAPFRNEGVISGAGALEINSTYLNTGTFAPGNPIGKLAIDATAFSPAGTKIEIAIGDSFDIKGGNDTLHIGGAGVYNVSNTVINITGSAYAPLDSVYTIMTTTGTFAGTFKAATFPDYFGELTVAPKSVTIKKIKAGPAIVAWGTISATANNGQVVVNWNTLQEVVTTNFTIEHSLNGTDFTPIGTTPAKGNSATTNPYSFTHTSPGMGVLNYYRIRHTDANGQVTYSPVASVRVNTSGAVVLLSPNPVRGALYFDVQASEVLIAAVNAAGQTIRTWRPASGLHVENISNWAPGIYHFVIYQNGKRIAVQKIVKL